MYRFIRSNLRGDRDFGFPVRVGRFAGKNDIASLRIAPDKNFLGVESVGNGKTDRLALSVDE
jgi:hypothetical protein